MTYVAWTVCGSAGCSIHYWSAAGGMHAQPSVTGMDQYAATIDEATGQMYYGQDRRGVCGRSATIRRALIGSSTATILASFPTGIDTGCEMSLAPNPATSHTDLYYERWPCRSKAGDIYALRGVDTV
jgi:hypothetical protein